MSEALLSVAAFYEKAGVVHDLEIGKWFIWLIKGWINLELVTYRRWVKIRRVR